jgi:hypothetical protein
LRTEGSEPRADEEEGLLMQKRLPDMFTLDAIVNLPDGSEYEVKIKHQMTLAGLQDMIGTLVEQVPHATSFVFSPVRHVTIVEEIIN